MKIVRNLIKMIIFAALALAVTLYTGHVVRPLNTDVAVNTIETFHSLPSDSLDVMIFGSSHAWRGIDPLAMYEDYGVGAYNYACNWQRINTTKLFLKDALISQSPKVAVIDTVTVCKVLEDSDLNGEIYYTKPIRNAAGKSDYLMQTLGGDPERIFGYYFPIYNFHESWSSLGEDSFKWNSNNNDFLASMGMLFTKKIRPQTIKDYTKFKQTDSFEESSIKELDEILEICKENDVQVVFTLVPWGCKRFKYIDVMKKYADEHDIPFLNMFENYEEIGIDPAVDFFDEQHLNITGAEKVGSYLGKFISENYDVRDMREVEDNLWEKAKLRERDTNLNPDDVG